jgi:exodeoxyribonuclease VII large subunit
MNQSTKIQALDVSQLNTLVQTLIETEPVLSDLWVVGEITNLKTYNYGNQMYFNLSDGNATVNCVLYANFKENLSFEPKNGTQVFVRGKMKLFNKRGSLSLQVSYMMEKGEGTLTKQFEALKKKLLEEGIFDEEKKIPLPKYPDTICVITSVNSAAMWDFIRIFRRTSKHTKITIIEATMQGPNCPSSVSRALKEAEKKKPDAIAIVRGGGSAEDLAGFNHEPLVRHIASSQTPIVTGIGHEIDYSLSDFAADHRAATPTAAAQILGQHFVHFHSIFLPTLKSQGRELLSRWELYKSDTFLLLNDADKSMASIYTQIQKRIETLLATLRGCDPLHKLRQGFSICRHEKDGKIIRSKTAVRHDENINIEFADGWISAKVEATNDN